MSKVSEQWSKANATSQGRTDANLANDSNNLGGIPAEEYATKKYVQDYHNGKETNLKQYIDQQDASVLEQAKEYTNSQIRNQDFSNFAEMKDLQTLNENLNSKITEGLNAQKQYTDQKTNQIVEDVNANFQDIENSISSLNGTVNNLFGSVSNGKAQIAEAITDKGVPTSASDSYSTMAGNIRAIPQTGGGGGIIPSGYYYTGDATATPYDILQGKTAYGKNGKIEGLLKIDENSGKPSYSVGDVEKVYGTAKDKILRTVNEISGSEREKIALLRTDEKIEGVVYLDNSNVIIDDLGSTRGKKSSYSISSLGLTNSSEEIQGIFTTEQSDYLEKVFNLIIITGKSGENLKLHIYEITQIINTDETSGQYMTWGISETSIQNALHYETTMPNTTNLKACFDHNTNEFNLGGCRFAIYAEINSLKVGIFEFKYNISTDKKSNREIKQLSYISTSIDIDPGYSFGDTTRAPIGFFGATPQRTLVIYTSSGYAAIIIYNDTWTEKKGNIRISLVENNKDGYIFRDLTHYFAGNSYFKLTIDYEKIQYTQTLEKTIDTSKLLHSSYSSGYLDSGAAHYFTDVGENYLIAVKGYTDNIVYSENTTCKVYKMDMNGTTPFEEVYSISENNYDAYGNRTGYALILSPDEKCLAIDCESENHFPTTLNIFNTEPDYSEVIALLYQGEYYYRGAFGLLTATPNDVRPGKTFIGQNGTVETGTMEV